MKKPYSLRSGGHVILDWMSYLQKKLLEIADPQIRQCLEELAIVTGHDPATFENVMLIHSLSMCLHSNGAGEKGTPITRKLLDSYDPHDAFVLRVKVGKLEDVMHHVCRELASMKGRNVEEFSGTALHLFLNRVAVSKKPQIQKKNWKLNWQIDPRTGR